MPLRAPVLVFVALSLAGTACGRLNDAGVGDPGELRIEHPTGAADLVLREEYVGGFTSADVILAGIPAFSLYGDGRLVTEGAHTEIYPGPALPSLLVRQLSEDAVQAILALARDAGLTDGDRQYANGCIVDAPDTRFTVHAGGRTSVVTASALGMGPPSCPGSDPRAERRLTEFSRSLATLERWLPAGSIGTAEPYAPSGLRVYVRPYQPDRALTEPAIAWPGPRLRARGDATRSMYEPTCVAVDPHDIVAVLNEAGSANQLTPWTSRGDRFSILFRPLLPDESGC